MTTLGQPLRLGIMSTSRKENERRLPIHPRHFDRIDAGAAERGSTLEHGYGEPFGVSDERAGAARSPACVTRDELLAGCRRRRCCPSRSTRTWRQMREGQILWGWPHCVQDRRSPSSPSTGG